MRKVTRKLSLQRQTVRKLDAEELAAAAGGIEVSDTSLSLQPKVSINCPATWNCSNRRSVLGNDCASIVQCGGNTTNGFVIKP